jgi:hypothetical protein
VQFRVLIAVAVFLGSYLPLSLILLAQDFDYGATHQSFCWRLWTQGCSLPLKNPAFAIGILAACAVCFVITLGSLAAVRPKQEVRITEAKHTPADLMNYTLPYIVSVMSIDYQESGKFVGFLIFLGWMFWITYKSGQIILNPLLIVLGWRLYEVSYTFAGSTDPQTGNALVKGRIEAGQRYRQQPVQDVLIIKNAGPGGG